MLGMAALAVGTFLVSESRVRRHYPDGFADIAFSNICIIFSICAFDCAVTALTNSDIAIA